MAIKTDGKVLPLVTVLSCIATAFAISTGLFDRGSSSGSLYEKMLTSERNIVRIDQSILDTNKKIESILSMLSERSSDIRVLNERLAGIKTELERVNRKLEERGEIRR